MFLVKDEDSGSDRDLKIKTFIENDPPIAVILAAVHFEWVLRRAIIALGTSPNVEIRKKLKNCNGTARFKELWNEEVKPRFGKRLTEIIKDWNGLLKSFDLRHKLVHGVASCTSDYAASRVDWYLEAAQNVEQFAKANAVDLYQNLPIRRKTN